MKEIDPIIFNESPKTFMEILKAHNREVQFANALAFFFRPKEKHGLKTLFIDALLNTNCTKLMAGPLENDSKIVKFTDNAGEDLVYNMHQVKVKVEEKTERKNRIDLVIESDTFVIGIEFKINHHLNNPLADYRKHLLEKPDGKRLYLLVLTPKKKAFEQAIADTTTTKEFKQVMISHFFDKIEEMRPRYCNEMEKNFNSCIPFKDLLQTVKNRNIRFQRQTVLENLRQEINKTFECNLHRKDFLEIKKKGYALKIRIITQANLTETTTETGWRIEKWVNSKNIQTLKNLNSQATFEEIIKAIKTALNQQN